MDNKKDDIIDPIPADFDKVVEKVAQPATHNPNKNKGMMVKGGLQPAGPAQGVLDLGIEIQRDVNGKKHKDEDEHGNRSNI